MKIIRLGQTLCDGSGLPPIPIPSTNLELFLRHNFNQYATEDASGTPVSPPYSSNASTMPANNPLTSWVDSTSGSSIQAEQTILADRPTYNSGSAACDGTQYFDMDTTINLTGEFTIYIKSKLNGTSNKALIGGSTSNFWRISNNKEFRARIGGVTNNLFTEATDIISTGTKAMYTFVIQRDSSGYLSMFVNGGDASGQYSDKAWGVTTNQDTDTMAISNIGATADDTQNMDGQIRSVVIYSTDHNATERQQVYNYI